MSELVGFAIASDMQLGVLVVLVVGASGFVSLGAGVLVMR